MRKFAFKIFGFVLPVLLFAIVLEVLLRQIPNDYIFKKEYLDAHSNEIEVLILGSSHSYFGIDPIYFDLETFNGSHIAQFLQYDLKIVKNYENRFTNLKYIVLPISAFTMFATGTEARRIKNYVLYYNIKSFNSFKDFTEIFNNSLENNLKRFTSFYLFGEAHVKVSELGWATSYKSENAKDLLKAQRPAIATQSNRNLYSKKITDIYKANTVLLNTFIERLA